jgi:hypothetical protein
VGTQPENNRKTRQINVLQQINHVLEQTKLTSQNEGDT